MSTNDWFEDFFHGLAVDFWVAVAPAADADLPFLEKTFGAPGGAILDVACGAGRHSIPLARRGYHVTGVDLSATFLVRCLGATASTARSVSATASAIAIATARARSCVRSPRR